MHAGELRECVNIERRAEVEDDYGNHVGEWVSLRAEPFRANIRPIRGRESEIAGANTGTQIYKITLRWTPVTGALLTTDRIVNKQTGKEYNIHSIADFTERSRYIEMMCEAGTATG